MYENEITVKVDLSFEELVLLLENKGFKKKEEYVVNDLYLVDKNVDLSIDSLEVLKRCVLARNIGNFKFTLTYKHKEYDELENIISQSKTEVEVKDINASIAFMKCIGYKELIKIKDIIAVYEKDDLQLAVERVNDSYLFIEIEENEAIHGIENLISKLNAIGIPYDDSNYFVKKAKIIFEEQYR